MFGDRCRFSHAAVEVENGAEEKFPDTGFIGLEPRKVDGRIGSKSKSGSVVGKNVESEVDATELRGD